MSGGVVDVAERGARTLARVSSEMVHAHKEFFGRGPTAARSWMLDDLLVIVMRGGMTTAEKTLLQSGRRDEVRQFRQLFQKETTGPLTRMIAGLTGRNVINHQSQVLFDPDLIVEIFVFDSKVEEEAVRATGEGHAGEAGPAPTPRGR